MTIYPSSHYIRIHVLSTIQYTFPQRKENLFNNQELLLFMIIPPIIMTLMFNQGVKV